MRAFFLYQRKQGMTIFNVLPHITYSKDKDMEDGFQIDIGWLFWNLCLWFT